MDLQRLVHLKKYLLIWAITIGMLVLLHLVGVYVFLGGKYVWLPGGSVSIALIGKPLDVMNPLSYGWSAGDNLVFRFMFRGLIQYNPENANFYGDLATCDLGNIQRIECTLKNNIEWSDGTAIQVADVIATFDAFKKSAVDDKMLNFIKWVTVTSSDGKIIVTSKTKNPLVLDLLSYPILRSDIIEQIETNRFGTGLYITSGLYKFSETVRDEEYGFDRITLVRNEASSLPGAWLDKIHFKYFPDNLTLERGLETVNIIIPPGRDINISIWWRFKEQTYSAYEFFWVFFHTDRLSTTLRNSLHWNIGTLLSGSIDDGHKSVSNLFWDNGDTLPTKTLGNFSDILRKAGYKKKVEILQDIENEPTSVTGGVVYDAPKYFENRQRSNVLFLTPPDKDKWMILYGNIPETTTSVNIGEYTLQEFRPGNTEFAYKISETNGTIKAWKNTYELLLNSGTITATGETLTIYFSADTGALDGFKKEVDSVYLERLNTPALIAERQSKKEERKKIFAELDDRYYYDAKWEAFSLKVWYVTWVQGTDFYALKVEKILKDLGIFTELVAYKASDIADIIKTGKKDYDILILWIETPGNIGHIGQLFLSSEADVGVNFSNIESPRLDEMFIGLRSATERDKVNGITQEITSFMREESFFLPLSSPLKTIYVDRNLKWVKPIEVVPDISYFYNAFNYISIKDTYIIEAAGKSISGYVSWIFHLVF
jgi:ABC-type transport system substrate-binding protein